MLTNIKDDIPNFEDNFHSYSLEIIEEILSKLCDLDTFKSYFETEIEFMVDKHAINHDAFKKAFEYVQVK